jgi:putative ABC transport system permease protein
MTLHPLLASLQRHKITAGLLTLQIALTCAIVCNIAFLIVGRIDGMRPVTGVDEARTLVIESSRTLGGSVLTAQQVDLQTLRGVPGVLAAAALDTVPLGHASWTTGARSAPRSVPTGVDAIVSILDGSPGEVTALGLHLVDGRDFASADYAPLDAADGYTGLTHVATAIISKALGRKLWPGLPALGQALYIDDQPYRVVGVLDHLAAPRLGKPGQEEFTLLLPLLVDTPRTMYALRAEPAQLDRVMRAAIDRLNAIDPERIIGKTRRFDDIRRDYFQHDVTMLGLLIASALGLLFVTGLGVAGLASFWVQQRYRQIGIRRAVGATRRDILHHFQIENAVIVVAGLLVGAALAIVLNQLLMKHYELPRLPLAYLPATGLGLLLLGQAAVWSPARRAAAIPPVSAIRAA